MVEGEQETLIKLRLFTYNLRLVNTRKARGLTQAQLSQLVGKQIQRISEIELLKDFPTEDEAQDIADALQVDKSWLFPPELGKFKDVRREAFLTREQALQLEWIRPLELPAELPSEELKEALREVLQTLKPREREIITLRFGLEDGISLTLEQVAVEMKKRTGWDVNSRETIRAIEAKALRKLRYPSRSRGLKEFLS